MREVPFLYTALKDRPKIFQLITVCLFSFFVSIVVMGLVAATQKQKSYSSKPPAGYTASQVKTNLAHAK